MCVSPKHMVCLTSTSHMFIRGPAYQWPHACTTAGTHPTFAGLFVPYPFIGLRCSCFKDFCFQALLPFSWGVAALEENEGHPFGSVPFEFPFANRMATLNHAWLAPHQACPSVTATHKREKESRQWRPHNNRGALSGHIFVMHRLGPLGIATGSM